MDLFGRRRIAQLEESLAQKDDEYTALASQLRAAQNQVEYLVRTIRDMDQEIWNMGQKTDWSQQRSHFMKLHDEMTARKDAESNRIGDILRGELIDTYAPNMLQKRLGK
jgi:hypothetical protein